MAGLDGRGAVGPETSTGLIRSREPHATWPVALPRNRGPYACLPPGRPSAAIVAATSASGRAPTSTVTTGSSGLGSSSASNWLRSNEAGMYS